MTNKEGFYFTLKANDYKILDNAIEGPQLQIRWFDIYVNSFDKTNYENFRNDEFKWPQYSQKILAEINNGVASSDFTKIYSYTCDVTLGTWDYKSNSFPIAEMWSGLQIVKYSLAYNDFTIRYSPTWNDKYFDLKLQMDPLKAESFIASRKDYNGNVNRKITAKIIYNVVNKRIVRTETSVSLGIYMHKIIFLNGNTILGEIKPRIDFFDKVNLITNDVNPKIQDIDGNVYHTVTIGTQVWTVENLKTTKYNDGSIIPNVKEQTAWAKKNNPAYCWYNNDLKNKSTYGGLYNWYAVNTGILAPKGWHIATDAEWSTLYDFLGRTDKAGGKLKESGTIHWESPNVGATNETGFTALPSPFRDSLGQFSEGKGFAGFWSSTEYESNFAFSRGLYSNDGIFSKQSPSKEFGLAVRCVRDF